MKLSKDQIRINNLMLTLQNTIDGIGKQTKPLNQYQMGMQDGIRLSARIIRESEENKIKC